MEHTEGTLKEPFSYTNKRIQTQQHEQAGNSYLMAIAAVIVGLPLPILNLIAAIGYYFAYRKAAYFVRWHCIQSILGQVALIPFNSVALAWTIGILLRSLWIPENGNITGSILAYRTTETFTYYWLYIIFVILLNIAEFIVVLKTASKVRNGHNVRWWGIAPIVDRLCSKEDRNPYKIKGQ